MNIISGSPHRRCHLVKQWRLVYLEVTLKEIWTIFNSECDDMMLNYTIRCLHYFITFIIRSEIATFVTIWEWMSLIFYEAEVRIDKNHSKNLCCVAQVKSEGWLTCAELITYWSCLAAWVSVTFEVQYFIFFILVDYVEEVHLDNSFWQGEHYNRFHSLASCCHVWETFFNSSCLSTKRTVWSQGAFTWETLKTLRIYALIRTLTRL